VEPIPESRRVLEELAKTDEMTIGPTLQRTVDHIEQMIPSCVGVSVSLFDSGLTFTFVASTRHTRVVDAAQYLNDDGPCQDAAIEGTEIVSENLLDEDRWQLMAQVAANNGIRSSLSVPLRDGDRTVGSINLYGDTTAAFKDADRELAALFGAAVQDAVVNADLSMASRENAENAMDKLRANDLAAQATGVLAQREGIPVSAARQKLQAAAERAGIDEGTLAQAVIALYLT
jgi:GAF domain-containing protein